MSHPSFVQRHWRRVLVIALVGAVIAFIGSIVQPLRYRATMRVLIIQATSPTLDAFTAVKSSEKIGRNLGRIMVSSSFLGRVLQANPAIDQSAFPNVERKRRTFWEQTIETSVASETSVMEIRTYHTVQAQARAIAEGAATVLVRDVADYTGSQDVEVKVIDPPIVSRFPMKPNLLVNTTLGFIIGALLGLGVTYLRMG